MAAGLVTSACTARADSHDVATPPSTSSTTSTATASADAGSTTTAASPGATSQPRRATPTTRPAAAPAPAGANDQPAPSAGGENAAADGGRTGPPGAFARTLLRPSPARALVVEIIAEPGASVSSAASSLVERTLEQASAKPVSVVLTAGPTAPSPAWDEVSIAEYADRSARVTSDASTAAIRFLALHGGFAPDDNAIGVAVRGDVFAIFVDRVKNSGTPLVDAATVEQAVAVHELGHLLGLVDIALDRNRDDPDHPFHSRNRGSVMFWAIDTDLVGQILGGPPPRSFDRDDDADLAALRSGA